MLTGFDFSHMKPALIHDVKLMDVKTGDILTDKMRMLFLSLKYLGDKSWQDFNTEIEKIMYLIKNMDKMDKESEAYKSKEYQDLFDASETSNMACEQMVSYYNSLQRLLDDEIWREEVRQEVKQEVRLELEQKVKQEGITEGRTEGIEETALKMIKYGISDDMIMICTGLTESDIAKLRAKLN